MVRSGIGPDATVVLYGYAPALGFWLMKLYGHQDVRILDCSRATWSTQGRPCGSAATAPGTGSIHLGVADARVRATQEAVRDAIGRPGTTLLDVRSAAEYTGECFWPSGGMQPGGRAGHVPSAVHQPIDGLYNPEGSVRLPAELREHLLGCRPRRPGRTDHLLHDRRPRRHRMVRAHVPARPVTPASTTDHGPNGAACPIPPSNATTVSRGRGRARC